MSDKQVDYLNIRPLITKEKAPFLNQIVELYQEAGWWEMKEVRPSYLTALIEGSFCFFAAIVEGRVIGMGRVISDGISDGYIQDVFIKKDFQQQHIGHEIVVRLEQYCEDNGLEWVGLIATPGNAHFYETLGFHMLENFTPMLLQRKH